MGRQKSVFRFALLILWLSAGCVYSSSENPWLKSLMKDDSDASVAGKPMEGSEGASQKDVTQPQEPSDPQVECPSPPGQNDLVPPVASPIPQNPVTRQTYIDYMTGQIYSANQPQNTYAEILLLAGKEGICKNWGPGGVIISMSALALYDAAEDKESVKDYLNYVKDCLQVFKQEMEKKIAENEKNGVPGQQYYNWNPEAIELDVRILKEKGVLTPQDDPWIRDMILKLNKTVYVWNTNPNDSKSYTFWRGPHHRSQGEGLMKRLAALRYPDAPEAAEWKQYADTVWEDWWHYGEIGINDTDYFFNSFTRLALVAWMLNMDEVFTADRTKNLRERLLSQVTGDGALFPFGPHTGWMQGLPDTIFLMELFATKTKDGRFKGAAHRLMNYLLYQKEFMPQTGAYQDAMQRLALAYFVADDSVLPVDPDPASKLSYGKEYLRIDEKSKEASNHYLPLPVDKDWPKKGTIDVSAVLTDHVVPAKMFLESGHRPGDLTVLVEVNPRSAPVNPGGILGMMSHGSALAMSDSAKKYSTRQNMLSIIDRTNNPDLQTLEDLNWKGFTFPAEQHFVANPNPYKHLWAEPYLVEVEVDPFKDYSLATYARVTTENHLGYPVTNRRDFLFVKNRFLVLRDVATFAQGFEVRLDPVWHTQKWDSKGDHWINTFMEHPLSLGLPDHIPMGNPRWDLLVYHAPRPERKLTITENGPIDWLTDYDPDPKAFLPLTVHYLWDGMVKPNEPMSFAQILVPHDPKESASTIASGITVLADTPEMTVMRLKGTKGREEWVVLNTNGGDVKVEGLATNGKQVYLDLQDGKVVRILAVEASYLALDGKDLFRKDQRITVDGVLPPPECL